MRKHSARMEKCELDRKRSAETCLLQMGRFDSDIDNQVQKYYIHALAGIVKGNGQVCSHVMDSQSSYLGTELRV